MERQARGSFEITMVSQPLHEAAQGSGLSRRSMAKTYAGALAGTSVGEFLSAGNPGSGSAGYVALEAFTGTLDGRHGRFALQHSGTMSAGTAQTRVAVVPGSGQDELQGLSGDLVIEMTPEGHRYHLTYRLAGE